MLFLFTGEEKFLLDKQLQKWKKAFIQKYGVNNLFQFQEDNFNIEEIANALLGGGLFDEKKFIIIKGYPKDGLQKVSSSLLDKLDDFIQKHIEQFNPENVVVFVSYKPDKRTKSYKFLIKHCEVKEFKPLTDKKLSTFLQKEYGLSLQVANLLLDKLGNNLFLINNEIHKLKLIADEITPELVEKYVFTNPSQDTFALLDNLENSSKAIDILNSLEEQQEDFFKLLGLLYWNLKNTILIAESKQKGHSAKEIAANLGIHPFVVSKIYAKKFDISKIIKFYNNLINLDFSIKTGQIANDLAYFYLKKLILDFN